MTGVEGAGALMLIDTMISLQGLERTLEQIRQANMMNVNFKKRMSESEKKAVTEAWQGALALAIQANKRTRVR